MAWPEAYAQIAAIVKDTPVTTKIGGAGDRFRLVDFGELSKTRTFAVRLGPNMHGVGPLMPSAQSLRTRWGGEVVVAYSFDAEDARLDQIIAADYLAIRTRLLDDAYWNRPTSTIESLNAGNSASLMPANLERLERGAARLHFPFNCETTGGA